MVEWAGSQLMCRPKANTAVFRPFPVIHQFRIEDGAGGRGKRFGWKGLLIAAEPWTG